VGAIDYYGYFVGRLCHAGQPRCAVFVGRRAACFMGPRKNILITAADERVTIAKIEDKIFMVKVFKRLTNLFP
jgi:hypothetical protein